MSEEMIKMRELRQDKARLIDAINNILTAFYRPGEYREVENVMDSARELIEDMGPERPAWARETPTGVKHE